MELIIGRKARTSCYMYSCYIISGYMPRIH